MCVCWWSGGAVSSGLGKIRGGVISRETALRNVKGETLRLIKLYAAMRWKVFFLKVKQHLRMNQNPFSLLLPPLSDHLEDFLMERISLCRGIRVWEALSRVICIVTCTEKGHSVIFICSLLRNQFNVLEVRTRLPIHFKATPYLFQFCNHP